MKNLIYLFCIIVLTACGKSEVNPDDNMIQLGECFVADNGTEICFISIEDSRCPSEAVCVWEGQAEVALEITIDNVSRAVLLIERAGHPDQAVTTIGNQTIRLVDVSPYPETTVVLDSSLYTITVEVE